MGHRPQAWGTGTVLTGILLLLLLLLLLQTSSIVPVDVTGILLLLLLLQTSSIVPVDVLEKLLTLFVVPKTRNQYKPESHNPETLKPINP